MFRVATLGAALFGLALAGVMPAAALSNIKVDQLGYLTWTPKVAVLARPMVGQGSPSSFDPGSSFEIRRVSDNGIAFTGAPASFGGGATHTQSGDQGWWADFSALSTPGDYYLTLGGGSNPGAQSYPFKIGPDIYTAALAASTKSYYYQRCGTAITAAYGGAWTHAACHVATESAAHLYDGGDQGAATARDITGGWHDAGDYRKYVSFTTEPLWDLLHSYEWYPCGYGDANGIPESGNGVPDVLDEVKWELDWLLKMQISGGANDGALYSGAFIIGTAGGSGDPSTESTPYYYANFSSAATGVGAFAFALGARILGSQPAYSAYAATLQAASLRAWAWLQAHPGNVTYNQTGFQNADANRSAPEDAGLRLLAAAELFALTGGSAYQAYFDANYNSAALTNNGHNPILNNYFETGASSIAERAMVSYALAPGATPAVVGAIRLSAKNGANNYPVAYYQTDLYRSFMWDGHYSWGSNQAKATWGDVCLWAIKIGADPTSNATWWNVASEYLHYFFGRNTLGWSFTSQSQLVGADQPITKFFHSWFAAGTPYGNDPAPGYLTGGPNQAYATDVGYSGGTPAYPPAGEPVQKSYKDWNTVWPDCSWTVTENGIYYQSKYQFLLSAFSGCTAPPGTPTPTLSVTPFAGSPTATFSATPSATPSGTATPVCQTLINGAESLGENGTWSGGMAIRSIVASGAAPAGAVTQGGYALYANITVSAAWDDGFANLQGALPSDWSPYSQLKMDVHVAAGLVAGATYTELLLRADCSSCAAGAGLWYQPISADAPDLVAGAQTVTWALDFSQGTLPAGALVSKLSLVYNNNASDPVGGLYIDNIRLIGACTSPTPTISPSPSVSPSASVTPSPSVTVTPSPSASVTPSPSPTQSPSFSASPSFSVSPTETPYAGSPTSTDTWVPTATGSPTGSQTPSPTASFSASPSITVSPSPTNSPTAILSATATVSPSCSASPTQALGSATPTPTFTPSSTPTPSVSPSPLPSATPSPSPTASAGLSPIATPLPDNGPLVIDAVAAWPDPNPSTLSIKLQGPADRVDIRIYTAAWILAARWEGGPYTWGWNRFDLDQGWSQALAQGIYYIQVRAYRGSVVSSSVTNKLYLLR